MSQSDVTGSHGQTWEGALPCDRMRAEKEANPLALRSLEVSVEVPGLWKGDGTFAQVGPALDSVSVAQLSKALQTLTLFQAQPGSGRDGVRGGHGAGRAGGSFATTSPHPQVKPTHPNAKAHSWAHRSQGAACSLSAPASPPPEPPARPAAPLSATWYLPALPTLGLILSGAGGPQGAGPGLWLL